MNVCRCRYDTCMLVAFLQQLLTFGGFYDEQREFLRVERVQVSHTCNSVHDVTISTSTPSFIITAAAASFPKCSTETGTVFLLC
jgi:dynein heavy chain 2, cytosolic